MGDELINLYNKNEMRENKLSKQTRTGQKRNRIIPIVLLIGGVLFVPIYMYIKSIYVPKTYINYLRNNYLLLFIGLSLFIGGGLGQYYILKFGKNINPAYIDWNEKGIYIIDRKGKKEFYEWKKIKNLRKVPGKYPDYGFNIEGQMSPRLVNKEIGRDLKEYYRKRKWNNNT